MGQHASRRDCFRNKRLYRAIVDLWLTIETHNGRLLQRIMDLKLPINQTKSDTPQGSLHLECLHLPLKVSNAVAEQYQEQRDLLAAWEVGKLTQGSA